MNQDSKSFCCPFCGSTLFERINSYKHYWFSCTICGNITRERKNSYCLEWLPKYFLSIFPKKFANSYIKELGKGLDDEDVYRYYLEDGPKTSKGTKWENQSRDLIKEFSSLNIPLAGKRLLDISGGPGYLVQELSGLCEKTVVTEFNEDAVQRMKSILNINALKYDFNSDKIHEITGETFDIVLIRYAINFCIDLDSFLQSLKQILNPNAVVYVSYALPTLGSCLRWQLYDYIYHVLYNPETMSKFFFKHGFTQIHSYQKKGNHYLAAEQRKFFPVFFPYRLAAWFKGVTQETVTQGITMIFSHASGVQKPF